MHKIRNSDTNNGMFVRYRLTQGTVQVKITWLHPGGGWVITEKNSTDRFSPLGRNGVVESDFGPAK